MRVVVTGGTGFIGKALSAALVRAGHEVTIVSRNPVRQGEAGLKHIAWEDLTKAVDGCGGIINLAGEPVAQRWTAKAKERIRESRLGALNKLEDAVRKARTKPKVLISASAVGYYGARGDEILTESSAAGSGFLPSVCVEWEAAANRFLEYGVRTSVLRIGVVLGPEGGALAKLLPIFKLGGGGPVGDGKQWMPWIHRDDLVALLLFALEFPGTGEVMNATAPSPARNKDFTAELARAVKRPAFLPAPAFALRLVLGEMASVLLESQRVVPHRTQELGFRFSFPELGPALRDLLK